MSTTTWVCQFPISLAVEGADCYRRMADAGLQRTLFCSVIYSPYRLVLPRYPQKAIYSLEEGRYYYQPEAQRYAGLPLAPTASADFAGRDLLGEMCAGAAASGMEAGAWVTIFANGAIAKGHPDWAVRNLYDSADRLFLCFNHPEVREYSLRVCEEIAERYPVDEIMLDKIPQACLEQNAFAGRIEPFLRTLGSFCFCPHCLAAGQAAGLDMAAHREQAVALAGQALAIPQHLINAQAAELTGTVLAAFDKRRPTEASQLRVLCGATDRRATPYLLKLLAGKAFDCEYKLTADALARIADPAAVSPLITLLNAGLITQRVAAAKALGAFDDRRALSALLKALAKDTTLVRMAAATALGGSKDARATAARQRAAKEDASSRVRAAAEQALKAP